jgi:ERCC4-type nuclease
MKLKLDNRENDLIQEITKQGLPEGVELVVEALPLGDIILNDNEKDILIIERKCIADLVASIKDGRYEEQSYRLSGLDHPNHNIMYLIEGDVNKQKAAVFRGGKFAGINTNTSSQNAMIYSAMFSLNFFKGFSVFRTFSLEETATFVLNTSKKLMKELKDGKQPYYSQTSNLAANATADEYVNVVKKVKKDNITHSNIGEIMLSQIPGISSVTASAIMQEFKTIDNLIQKCKEDKSILENICTVTSSGQRRKISKACVASIVFYLLNQ